MRKIDMPYEYYLHDNYNKVKDNCRNLMYSLEDLKRMLIDVEHVNQSKIDKVKIDIIDQTAKQCKAMLDISVTSNYNAEIESIEDELKQKRKDKANFIESTKNDI